MFGIQILPVKPWPSGLPQKAAGRQTADSRVHAWGISYAESAQVAIVCVQRNFYDRARDRLEGACRFAASEQSANDPSLRIGHISHHTTNNNVEQKGDGGLRMHIEVKSDPTD